MTHQLTIDYAGKRIERGLDMPIGVAHTYAAALAAEFNAGSYTLNEQQHPLEPEGAMD